MKKSKLTIASLLIISMLCTCFFTSCDKDTNCYLEVTVVDGADGANRAPIPGALVTVSQNNRVYAVGNTDQEGVFRASITKPLLVDIFATVDVTGEGYPSTQHWWREGKTAARLIDGNVREVTLTITEEVLHSSW